MGEKRKVSELGKRKLGALSLNKLLAGKIQKRGKKKKVVAFSDFIVVFPPLKELAYGGWERHMYRAMHAIVVHLIAKQIGYGDPFNCRPWMEVEFPCDHPKCDETDQNRRVEGSGYIDLDSAMSLGAYRQCFIDTLADNGLYKEMVVPMACAFIHKTAWVTRLKNFRVNSREFTEHVTQMGEDFCNSERLENCIRWRANQDDEWGAVDSEKFWEGFETCKKHNFKIFLLVVEYFMGRMCTLIDDLDRLFGRPFPASLDDILSQRKWEIEVLDWIELEKKEAYLFLYTTPGEFFYYKDFVMTDLVKPQPPSDPFPGIVIRR